MNIYYFQTEPNDEFLGGAVSTKELREWVKAKGAALPPTPQHVNFENIDYVGVRNYLDEISNEVVKRLSDDRIVHEAIQLLIANPDYPYEPRERDLILNYSAPEPARLICARWLLNRDTWSEWRNLIREGMDVGKLALLNGRTRKAIPWPGALNQNKKADQSEGGAEPMANGGFITEVQLTPASPPVTPTPGALVPLGGTSTLWTAERKTAARSRQAELKAQGIKAFAAITAAEYGVSPTRMRAVLKEKPIKKTAIKANGVWDV